MISSCWCCWTAAARKMWSRNYHKLPLCVRKGLKVAINSSDGTLNFIHLRCRPSLTNLPFSLHRSIISWGRHTQDFQLLIFCFKFQVTQKPCSVNWMQRVRKWNWKVTLKLSSRCFAYFLIHLLRVDSIHQSCHLSLGRTAWIYPVVDSKTFHFFLLCSAEFLFSYRRKSSS